jgi:hypothetical protein
MSGEQFSGRTPAGTFSTGRPIQINNLPFDKALTVHDDLGFSPGDFSEFSGQAMPTTTYSDPVNIIKYVTLDEGWRFAPLARKPNGNIRWDTVLIEGVEMRHPEGRFFIEWRQAMRF